GTCNSATGTCSNPSAPDGTQCSDGDASTCGDSCVAGECGGTFVPQPAAINDSVRLSKIPDDTTITCTDPPGGYNLYRGSGSAEASWSYDQTCLVEVASGSSASDTENPAVGTLFYYLVTRKVQCRESTLGFDSQAVERPNGHPCN